MIFSFLVIDFGWQLKNWIVVTNSVRESTRCAVAQSCSVNGTPLAGTAGVEQLTKSRIVSGGVIKNADKDSLIEVKVLYRNEVAPDDQITAGDSIIVCTSVHSKYITPFMPFLSMVTLGNNTVPKDLHLQAREEMRLEMTPPGNPTPSDGKCSFP